MRILMIVLMSTISVVGIFLIGNMREDKLDEKRSSIVVTDSLGRTVELPYPLSDVVVVNPYTAELISAVGAESAIKGIDRDIYENRAAFHIPMTKEMIVSLHGESGVNYEKIILMKPQAVIFDGGMHHKRASQILGLFGIKVLVIRADSALQFSDNCRLMGKIFGKEERAKELSQYFQRNVDYVERQLAGIPRKKVYYECRRFGRAVIPGEAFNEMLDAAHADNIFSDSHSIYVNNEMIILRNPEYIVRLSDVGEQYSYYPPSKSFFERVHQEIRNRPCWNYINAVKNDRIFIYSYYSQGGAGKLVGAFYLAKYLYPEYLPDLHPEDIFYTWLTKYERVPYIAGHTYPRFSLYEGGTD